MSMTLLDNLLYRSVWVRYGVVNGLFGLLIIINYFYLIYPTEQLLQQQLLLLKTQVKPLRLSRNQVIEKVADCLFKHQLTLVNFNYQKACQLNELSVQYGWATLNHTTFLRGKVHLH